MPFPRLLPFFSLLKLCLPIIHNPKTLNPFLALQVFLVLCIHSVPFSVYTLLASTWSFPLISSTLCVCVCVSNDLVYKNFSLMFSSCSLLPKNTLAFVGLCTRRDRDYRIGSNFWKLYVIRIGFALGELVSLVKVFRLEWVLFRCSECTTSYLLVGPACLWCLVLFSPKTLLPLCQALGAGQEFHGVFREFSSKKCKVCLVLSPLIWWPCAPLLFSHGLDPSQSSSRRLLRT